MQTKASNVTSSRG